MKIVVGYDGSEHSQRALERAYALAGEDDRLVVVVSAEPRLRTGVTEGAHQDPSEFEHRARAVADTRTRLAERGREAAMVEAYGDPGDAIVAAAEDAGLIVVGSRGHNRLERLLVGSVSTKVVQRAPCDVLVVR